jgi:hypothetical protein
MSQPESDEVELKIRDLQLQLRKLILLRSLVQFQKQLPALQEQLKVMTNVSVDTILKDFQFVSSATAVLTKAAVSMEMVALMRTEYLTVLDKHWDSDDMT